MSQDTTERITVRNWDDWFSMVKTSIPYYERYEQAVRTYLKHRGASELIGRPHRRAFYDGDFPIAESRRNQIILFMCIGAAPGFFLAFYLCARMLGQVNIAVLAGGVVGGMLVFAVLRALPTVIGHYIRIARVRSAETALEPYVTLMPQQFRNARCAQWFDDAYSAYNYRDFDTAAREVARMAKNTADYCNVQALIDVPFDGSGLSRARRTSKVHDEHAPYLPEDIKSHTTQGPRDWKHALHELIGMDDVKRQVARLENRVRVHKGSGAAVIGGNNMVLMGPAGVGKTSVARILTGMLADAGIIAENRIVEVEGGYLKSPYQGQTGKRVEAVCNWACGGVLFIDEAYLLFDDTSSDATGREACGVLLKYMEDHTQDLVVMLAGYTDDMERLIASNEGFRSRVRHKLKFSPYSNTELAQICELFLTNADIELERGATAKLAEVFGRVRDAAGFGGAREARNAADALIDIQADRIARTGGNAHLVTLADIDTWAHSRTNEAKDVRRSWLSVSGIDAKIVSASELEQHSRMIETPSSELLRGVVGQERAKDELATASARAQMLGADEACANVALLGPAGVGKTMFADIITRSLYETGRIAEPRMLDVTGDWFRASYVGQTGKRTEAALQWARGGVLFVDEAYLLVDEGSGGFGKEALGVIVNYMEKMPDLVIIMAGYEREMARLFEQNPGLTSRMPTQLHLAPYTIRELMLILQRMTRRCGFKIAKDVYRVLQHPIEACMSEADFGQARAMRTVMNAMIDVHALRWQADNTLDKRVLDTMDAAMALDRLGW